MKAIVAAAALLTMTFFQTFSAHGQCLISPVSLEQKVSLSSSIVQGRVIQKRSYLDAATGNIYTLNTVMVNAWLKNHSDRQEVQVITAGGVYHNKATIIYPSLQLEKGAEYLFFLEGNNFRKDDKSLRIQRPADLQTMVYADMQGVFRNEGNNYPDPFGKKSFSEAALFDQVTRLARSKALTPGGKEFSPRKAVQKRSPAANARVAAVDGFSPAVTNGGTVVPGEYVTITGAGFGAAQGNIFFSNADNGGATFVSSGVASDIVSWSDNSIIVKVPSGAGTGPFVVAGTTNMISATPLTVGYTHSEINDDFYDFGGVITRQRFYLRNLNGLGGYTFLFNNSFNANTAAVNSFKRAITTWQCATGVNFRAGSATAQGAVNDGLNVVAFSAGLPVGVLAQTLSNYSASAIPGTCTNTNTVWWATDMDIVFRPDPPVTGFSWQYGPAAATGSQFDFESVSVHELGHAIGLGHRIEPGAVMHYALSNGVTVRTPSATDISGVNSKLGYSTVATCFDPLDSGLPMQVSGCALPVTFISFSGIRKNNTTNDLEWVASHAVNNTGFAVERSADGVNFVELDFIGEDASSMAEKKYSYPDTRAGRYPWYYRLRQTDIDGKYSYSKVIFLKGENNDNWRVLASPDGQSINLYGNLQAGGAAKFQLISSSGQQVMTKEITQAILDISTPGLARGIYYYRLVDKSNSNIISGSVLLGNLR